MDAKLLDDMVAFQLLSSVSAANTAAATSGSGQWLDTANIEGDIAVTINNGAVTGSITGKLQCADDANGTNAVDIAGATFTAISAANKVQTIAVDPKSTAKRYIGFVGTVVTGPAVVGVTANYRTKYN